MDKGRQLLSDIIVYSKYAQYRADLCRRETWDEIVERNMQMHIRKFPHLEEIIRDAYKLVFKKKVLPSMRALQYGGKPIEKNNARGYNCFSKDTEFITSEGVKSFSDFSDGDMITVLTHKGRWRNATVRSYGTQKFNRVITKRGGNSLPNEIFVTSDHRWIKQTGDITTNLQEGDYLLGCPNVFDGFDYDLAEPMERLYWCYGFVFGDGTKLLKRGEYRYSLVRLCGNDVQYLPRFEEMGFSSSSSLSCGGDVIVYTGSYQKTAPDPSIDSPELIRAFVAGYLAADGAKTNCATALSKYRSIVASDEQHIDAIRKLFPIAGVFISSEQYLGDRETNYGKRNPCSRIFRLSTCVQSKTNSSTRVISIEDSGITDVAWCLEVEEDESFVLSNGLTTGNCSYLPLDNPISFSEAFFLLLSGCGVGFSVRKNEVDQLPPITIPTKQRKFVVGDSIEGWADSLRALLRAYFEGKPLPRFDFSDIRPKGSLISSGGIAPGPEPLRLGLEHVHSILRSKEEGSKLTAIECMDIVCHISDAVLSGGVRRSALICLFDVDDVDMATAKTSNWWEINPQRGRSNNSACLARGDEDRETFEKLWSVLSNSGSGEPGFFFTNDPNTGTNPCGEIRLRPFSFCNLCEINTSDIESQDDFDDRAVAAAIIGTLQASYTDFHYLRPQWHETTEEDALLGIGLTGIASNVVFNYDMQRAADYTIKANETIASIIGINTAARITTVKPSGTASSLLGCSSGIHAWHDKFYIRRIRLSKNEPIYAYLMAYMPELMENEFFNPDNMAVFSIPIKAPEGAVTRHESAIDLLERVKHVYNEWIIPGHVRGNDTNNVSTTVSVKEDEWDTVGEWLWENRDNFTAISCLPFADANYPQMPFESIDEEEYNRLMEYVKPLNPEIIVEYSDTTDTKDQVACSSGQCEL